jgi:glycerol transport system ATP-binding protein
MTWRFEQVTKSVAGDPHLYETSVELMPGTLNVLLGPTLAGKTSMMRLFAGLDRPTTGHVRVDDREVSSIPTQKRGVAMVYQQFINYPSFTVYENIASPLRRAGLSTDAVDAKVREAASMLRIDRFLDRLPAELSGGQQQRTAIARALVKEADLLLLDEPLVNLDYKLREELRQELREIFARREATVVYATTEPHEALLMGGQILVMDKGRVLQTGRTVDVFRRPATVEVGFVFSDPPMNLIAGRVAGGGATLGEDIRVPLAGHLAGLAEGRYRFGVRAHHLFLAPSSDHDVAIPTRVELAEVSGSETFIHAQHGGVHVVVQEEGVHGFDLNEDLTVYVHPERLFAFGDDGTLLSAPGAASDTSPGAAAGGG